MGQRFQGFIKMANPTTSLKKELKDKKNYKQNLVKFVEDNKTVKEFEKGFGSGEDIILAFHHQWLYGRAAVLSVLTILEFNKGCYESENVMNKEFSNYRGLKPKKTVEEVLNLLRYKTDVLCQYTRVGIDRYVNLNEEEEDGIEYTQDFTIGDNNDGIYIIDASTNKYCFMNIGYHDKSYTSACALPSMTPVSAADYVKAYYPETINKVSKESYGDKVEKQVKQNKTINQEFLKRFKGFEVMTAQEVREMFPKLAKQIKDEKTKNNGK